MKYTNAELLDKRAKYFTSPHPLIIESMNYSIIIIITLLFSSIAIMLAHDGSSELTGFQPDGALDTPCCGPEPINGTTGTPLYMKGSDSSQGRLSKDFPGNNNSETENILPGTGIYEQHLGEWISEPFVYDWFFEGLLQIQIAAYGNGYSYTTDMRFEILLGGEVIYEVEVHENPLRPSLKFWIANVTLSLSVAPGQVVGFSLYIIENGPGGELRWDATSAPGMMWFHAPSTVITVHDQNDGGKHTTTMKVSSVWGRDDIDDIGIFAAKSPEQLGENPWIDVCNCTLISLDDQATIDWIIVESDDGTVIGVWVWQEPGNIPPFAMVVCYAYDGGEAPAFRAEVAAQDEDSTDESYSLSNGITGFMFISGIILLAIMISFITLLRRKNLEEDLDDNDQMNDLTGDYLDTSETNSNFIIPKKMIITTIIAVMLIIVPIFTVILDSSEGEKQDFSLTSIDGETFRLSDFRGKVVFLDFGGIQCSGCEEVLKSMQALYPKMKGKGVIFMSINVVPSDSDSDLKKWREDNDIPTGNWIIAQDTADLVVKYNAYLIPKLLVINKEGYITYEHTGASSRSTIENEIEDAIEGNAIPVETKQYGLWTLAFLAGVAMFFSPCAFPLLPGYMMLYFNINEEKSAKRMKGYAKGLKTGCIAAVGIFTVILFYGILFALASDVVGEVNWDQFTYLVVVVLLIFGLMMLTEVQYGFLTDPIHRMKEMISLLFMKVGGQKVVEGLERIIGRTTHSNFSFSDAKKNGNLGVYSFGVGYGGVAAGCHAPIFLAIFLAALGQGFLPALSIFIFFGLGMGIIMIAISLLLATAKTRAIDWLKTHTLLIKKMTGISMIVIAAFLLAINV